MTTPPHDSPPPGNPFERWGIDPMQGAAAITERMRELAAAAPDEATRAEIRAAWEQLTMHPARRFSAAVGAHPDSYHVALVSPPPPRRARAKALDLQLSDLTLRPSVLDALDMRDLAYSALPDTNPASDPVFAPRKKW